MKCTQENWEEIKPILEKKVQIEWVENFKQCPYLVTNITNRLGVVSNVMNKDKDSHNRKVYEEWNKDIFLQACGINTKFKAGEKVKIINRKPYNTTGYVPDCYKPNGYVGKECYLIHTGFEVELRQNADGTGEYFGLYSDKKHHFNDDDLELVVDFVLPEKWCVKVTEENKDIVHRWKLDNTSRSTFTGAGHYVESSGTWDNKVSSGHTEITYDQFLKHVLKQETKMVQKLTLAQLKDLYLASNCGDWQSRIKSYISDNIFAKDDTLISIKDEDITYARKNATAAQLDMLKNAGVKFEEKPKYKVGDWVTFTEDWSTVFCKGDVWQLSKDGCGILTVGETNVYGIIDLSNYFRPATEEEITKAKCPYKDGDLLVVRNASEWELRYSNGTLSSEGRAVCYQNQEKSGRTSCWLNHKLANITLDE